MCCPSCGLLGSYGSSRAGERNRTRNAARAHKIHPLSSTRTAPRTTPLIAFRHLHRSPPPLTASNERPPKYRPPASALGSSRHSRRPALAALAAPTVVAAPRLGRRARRRIPLASGSVAPRCENSSAPWPVSLATVGLLRRTPCSQLRSRGRIFERRAALLSGAARHCATLIQPHISLLRPRTDARSPTSPLRSLSPIGPRFSNPPI